MKPRALSSAANTELPAGAIPAAAIIAVATRIGVTIIIAVTIVSVKTQASGDLGTGRVPDHPASEQAGRAE
jgi:hypothetical protein